MKLRDYELTKELRKDFELLSFIDDVRSFVNVGSNSVLQIISLTGETGDISTTEIITPSVAWFFRVNVYMICTTAGGGTLTCTIGWTDASGSKTLNVSGDVNLNNIANGATGMAFLRANASAITYATAIAGKSGSPQYSLYIVLEQLG